MEMWGELPSSFRSVLKAWAPVPMVLANQPYGSMQECDSALVLPSPSPNNAEDHPGPH